jgi:hypothetical protein
MRTACAAWGKPSYATIPFDVITHARVDVLPDRTAETLIAWLRACPGVEIVCRAGFALLRQRILLN